MTSVQITQITPNELEALIHSVISKTISLPTKEKQPEIINREELCKRLDITEPTAIRWEKKGKIPCFRIGSNVRYKWDSVLESLENKKNR